MNRADVTELHYITAIANLPSILRHGILSHNLVAKISHHSVAMEEIQERRQNKRIPGAGYLHDYANLYFDAHNPMLSKCRARNDEICVLKIDPRVIDQTGVVVSDRNAAADMARFFPVDDGLTAINYNRVFARYWTHPDDFYEERLHKSQKCAEVLVPQRVDENLIGGAYVANPRAMNAVEAVSFRLSVRVRGDMFF
jgi:hypothetical protein